MSMTFAETKRLSNDADCSNTEWCQSFLCHCRNTTDAKKSIVGLKKHWPHMFGQQQRPQQRPQRPQRRDENLDWQTINSLVREAGAIDTPLLSSYLAWTRTETQARATIAILRQTEQRIWKYRSTPHVTNN